MKTATAFIVIKISAKAEILFLLDFLSENCAKRALNEKPQTFLQLSAPSNCTENQWQCLNKHCIPKEYVCNDNYDCPDRSDEEIGCTLSLPCDTFQCKNGHCIPHEWRCDGSDDCHDNSDELGCGRN